LKTFRGRAVKGEKDRWVEGRALVERNTVSFLGYVDESGIVVDPDSENRGISVAGRVFLFPSAKGSTVGSYVLVTLKKRGVSPTALVMVEPSLVVISGAVVAQIPFIYGVEERILKEVRTGDFIKLNPLRGEVRALDSGVDDNGG